jgi:hypothetical protein
MVSPGGTVNRMCVACGAKFYVATESKTAWTPGPWTYDQPALSFRIKAGDLEIADAIAKVANGVSKRYVFEPEAEANARLISKAPEMAELLRRAAPWLGKMIADGAHLNCVMPRDCEVTLEQIERLLAEIEGGGK